MRTCVRVSVCLSVWEGAIDCWIPLLSCLEIDSFCSVVASGTVLLFSEKVCYTTVACARFHLALTVCVPVSASACPTHPSSHACVLALNMKGEVLYSSCDAQGREYRGWRSHSFLFD